jgi:pilus assembly protein Flp/PilA
MRTRLKTLVDDDGASLMALAELPRGCSSNSGEIHPSAIITSKPSPLARDPSTQQCRPPHLYAMSSNAVGEALRTPPVDGSRGDDLFDPCRMAKWLPMLLIEPGAGSSRSGLGETVMSTSVRFFAAWVAAHVKDERGASLVEYALLVALIAVVCILAVTFLGKSASSKFSSVGSAIK